MNFGELTDEATSSQSWTKPWTSASISSIRRIARSWFGTKPVRGRPSRRQSVCSFLDLAPLGRPLLRHPRGEARSDRRPAGGCGLRAALGAVARFQRRSAGIGRRLLGGAESFIITAAVSWGLALVDPRIAWVGSAMFAAFAIGVLAGSALYAAYGFAAVAFATRRLRSLLCCLLRPFRRLLR